MSPIPRPVEAVVRPIFLTDVDLWLVLTGPGTASKNHKAALTGATLTPTSQTATLQTLSPLGSFTSQGKATWTAALAYVQDWENLDSLSRYLFDNEGKPAELYFTPQSGVGTAWKVACPALVSGPVGGSGVNTSLPGSVTLGVTGRPVPMTIAQLATAFPTS